MSSRGQKRRISLVEVIERVLVNDDTSPSEEEIESLALYKNDVDLNQLIVQMHQLSQVS